MADITSGSVTIEDGVKKPEEFAPARKVSVTISFTVDPGTAPDAILDAAAGFADAKVNELLGREAIARTAPPAGKEFTESSPTKTRAKKATETKPAAEPDPFEVAPESPEVAAARAALAAKPEVAEDDEFTVKPTAEVASSDEFDVTVAPPKEISDADLNAAVQKKNGEINNSQAIRDLIGSFNTDPTRAFQLREIPQDKRPVFLERLAELKKA